MSKKQARKTVKFCILLVLLPLFGCGEMSALFPSSGIYQVGALVNGVALENVSLVRTNDQIRPFFANSVAGDPDLTGLLVYLRNSRGDITGKRVQYVINPHAEEHQTDSGTDAEDSAENPDELPSGETEEDILWPSARWGFNDSIHFAESDDIIIEVRSLDRNLPFFPMPEGLPIGAYSIVFEVLGGRNVLSRTEVEFFYLSDAEFYLNDISIFLPGVSSSRLIPPGATVMLEAGLDFDSFLDPYIIWYVGRNVISEGRVSEGAGSILWNTPIQAGFHSLRVEVFPFRMGPNFTGLSREIVLPVSPMASNAVYFFSEKPEFAPHSPLALGTAFPEMVLLAAAFAEAAEYADADISVSEISFPFLAEPEPPQLMRMFRFGGSLHDSLSPFLSQNDLIPLSQTRPNWKSVGQSFGLFTSPNDVYSLSPLAFFPEDENEGGGLFLLHVSPSNDGVIFNAFFPSVMHPREGVTMELFGRENGIFLRMSAAGENDTILPIHTFSHNVQAYIPITVEFFARPHRMEARLTLGDGSFGQSVTGSIRLRDAVSGEGRIRLGGTLAVMPAVLPAAIPVEIPDETLTQDDFSYLDDDFDFASAWSPDTSLIEESAPTTSIDNIADDIADTVVNTAAFPVLRASSIWNEFAILSSSIPLIHEDLFSIAAADETDETPEAESEDPEQNEPEESPADFLVEEEARYYYELTAVEEDPGAIIYTEGISVNIAETE